MMPNKIIFRDFSAECLNTTATLVSGVKREILFRKWYVSRGLIL